MDPENNPYVTIAKHHDGTTTVLPRYRWTPDREQAALDLAEGQCSMAEIARRAGTHPGAVNDWRRHPEFQARVAECRKVFRDQVLGFGIARKEARLAALQTRHDKLMEIIAARARVFEEDPRLAGVAGGDTGYVYEHMTAHGPEYLVDNKTIAMQNELAKQAAIELCEWNEGGGGPAVAVQIVVPATAPAASSAPTVTIGRM